MRRMRVRGMLWIVVMCTSMVMAQVDMTFSGVGNWTDPNLWDSGSVPGVVDLANYANISGANTVCTVNTDTGAFAGGSARMQVDGGATLMLEDGGIIAATTWTRIGISGVGTLNQTGGVFEVQNDKIGIGDKSGGVGAYIISGGTMTYAGDRGDIAVGSREGTGTLTIVGSAPVISMEELIVSERDGAAGTVEFVLDANGVSPIVLSNKANIDGKGDTTVSALVVSASAIPPVGDILLVDTVSDTNVAGAFDTVNGAPGVEGAEVVISCGGVTNTYLLTYAGGTGNDIVLQYVPKMAAMVVNPEDLSMGFDQAQYDRLVAMGYDVNVIPVGDVGSSFTVDNANTLDLLLISESISSSGADALIGTTTPTMHNESYGWDNWALTTKTSSIWVKGVNDLDVVNDVHPIMVDANVPVGTMSFYNSASAWTTELVSALAPGAVNLAQVTSEDQDYAIVFVIDEGDELADGSASPNRIAGFSVPADASYDASVMTDEAWAMWEATIRWLNHPTAAMVVNPADLTAGFDQAQYDRLDAKGYAVTVVPVGDVGSSFTVDAANAYDLLLVSESISSSGADPLIGTTTPVMHNESYGWDNWALTTKTNSVWVREISDVNIVDDSHAIVMDAGLSAGMMTFFSSTAAWTSELVSALAPGAVNLAQVTSEDQDYAIVFVIEQGGELADGSLAINRIAGFSIPADAAYDADVMTDDAWALWDATIDWLNP